MNNSNSICIMQQESINVYKPIKYKSKIIFGNITIMLEKKINLFHRLMIKLVFGIKVEKVSDDNE